MPAERYFSNAQFSENQNIFLTDQEFHHLVHVMRSKENDEIELVNGQGQLAKAHLSSIEKKRAIATIDKVETAPQQSKHIILAQAIPRINRLEFILEKGTELGMTDVWLFASEKSERKQFTEHQVERLQAITIAAMKQCGRLFLPKITLVPSIEKWDKKDIPSQAFFGDLNPIAPKLGNVLQTGKTQELLFCIGPESGFTEKEVEILIHKGLKGVNLHSNILRTDTAALVALTLLTHSS